EGCRSGRHAAAARIPANAVPISAIRKARNGPMPKQELLPEKVISGGQTGADQADLLAARRFGIPPGGWMPQGYQTTAGPAPELAREFGLREHAGGYAERTEANVRDADGTVHFAASFETLGEKCTLKWLRHHGKPYLDIDRADPPPPVLSQE